MVRLKEWMQISNLKLSTVTFDFQFVIQQLPCIQCTNTSRYMFVLHFHIYCTLNEYNCYFGIENSYTRDKQTV